MAGIGGWLTGLFGSENKARATGRNVNSDNYQYGGSADMAEHVADANIAAGNQAQGRRGVQVNYGQADQDRALGMQSRELGLQSRQNQDQVARMSLARAMGQTPSIAGMQAQRDMAAAQASQASMAGSARGAGALANAQRNAANNVANAQANISGQSQINAANERLAAEQSAANQFGNIRTGDQSARGQDLTSQAQSAQQAQSQAGFLDAQRARNDQMQSNYNQLAHQTRIAQLGANMNYEAQQSANALGAQGINAGVGGQNASMNQANGMNLLGMGQAAAGGIASFATAGQTPPPGRAKGGPVSGRAPYLVGEQGPELVVPAKDGYVIPAGPTAQAINQSPSLARALGISARADGGPIEGAPRTWGTGPGVGPSVSPAEAEWAAIKAVGDREAGGRDADSRVRDAATMMAIPGFSPGMGQAKDEPLVRADRETAAKVNAYEAQGLEPTEREAWQRDNAERRLATNGKNERKAAREMTRGQSLAAALGKSGNDMQRAAQGIDTAYHGGHGYTPAALIPLPARAMGGPMMGGGALVPLSGPGSGAAAPSFDVLTSSGGMDPMASLKAHSNFATQFQRNPGASPMGYSAREDGGPVQSGGQRPEVIVVPAAAASGTPNGFAGASSHDVIAPVAQDAYQKQATASERAAEDLDTLASQVDPIGSNLGLRGALGAAALVNHGRALGERYVVPALDKKAARLARALGWTK